MFGAGLLKGMGVTLRHAVETFRDDGRQTPSRYEDSHISGKNRRIIEQPIDQQGLLTIQYPEEKRLLPERFRYIPMLIWDTQKHEDRCTACGICAKVCPPQCIWIVRDSDENGKPVTRPAEFYIDAAVCMSCSFCVEFCPFDAIKMNHDFEIAVYDRYPQLVYDKAELTVPLEYYAALWPTQYAQEQELMRQKEEEAKRKEEEKARKAAEKAAKAQAASDEGAEGESTAKPAKGKRDIEALKRQAQEKAKQRKAQAAGGGSSVSDSGGDSGGNSGGDDAAAAKKARLEELKRKAQEKAKQRKQE